MKVQLIKPHTHARTHYEANDVIEVSEANAKWLADHGVIQQGNKDGRPLKAVPSTKD